MHDSEASAAEWVQVVEGARINEEIRGVEAEDAAGRRGEIERVVLVGVPRGEEAQRINIDVELVARVRGDGEAACDVREVPARVGALCAAIGEQPVDFPQVAAAARPRLTAAEEHAGGDAHALADATTLLANSNDESSAVGDPISLNCGTEAH